MERFLFLLPLGLLALYTLVEWRLLWTEGRHLRIRLLYWCLFSVPLAVLGPLWMLTGFPLPLLHLGWFLFFNLRLLLGAKLRRQFALLWGMLPLLTCGVHLACLGALALVLRSTLAAVLLSPPLRAISLSVALALLVFFLQLLTRNQVQVELFEAMADSEEVRSFLRLIRVASFLLLLDSLFAICADTAEATPLFLLCSNVLLLILSLRFLLLLYQLLKKQWRGLQYSKLQTEAQLRDQQNSKLWKLVYTDTLTGAFSRQYAMEQMEELMEQALAFSLVFLDLDRLKQINDRSGHRAGDAYLRQFVQAFGGELRGKDALARIGGDEFVVLMESCPESTATQRVAAIRQRMDSSDVWNHPFSFSFGVTFLPAGMKKDPEILLQEADHAMYADKQRLRRDL